MTTTTALRLMVVLSFNEGSLRDEIDNNVASLF